MSLAKEIVMHTTAKAPPALNGTAGSSIVSESTFTHCTVAPTVGASVDQNTQPAEAEVFVDNLPPPHEIDAATAAALRGAETVSRKKPLMTHSKDGTLLSPKKLRRLEKNRLSARECRRRKREATENLEHQINTLEAENMQLRLQLQIGQEAESSIADEQSQASQEIQALLQSGASEADIYAELEKYAEKYADYGKSRRSSIQFHLQHIENLLMPTQTTSIIMQAIQGGGGGATTNTETAAMTPTLLPASGPHDLREPKALFRYLVDYLQVTPEQASALKDSRLVAQEMDGCLESALAVLAELRQRLEQTGNDLETEFDQVRAILTPTQAAKFLVWVANNDACMHLLNELWDRVYTTERSNDESVGSPASQS